MTQRERRQRIQRLLGFSGGAVDGIFGANTLTRLEKALGITSAPKQQKEAEFDARTEKNLATLLPGKVTKAFRSLFRQASAIAAKEGCEVKVISGTRTWAQQDALYAKGRTKPGKIVTKARGGQSNHNFGVAVDFGIFKNGVYLDNKAKFSAVVLRIYKAIAKVAKALGILWGGDWKRFRDAPHFEFKTGLTLAQMRTRKRQGVPIVA